MNAADMSMQRLRQARRHACAGAVVASMAVPFAIAALLWRTTTPVFAIAALVVGIVLVLAFAGWRARRFNAAWLVRQLNARRRDLDDSADLLFASSTSLSPLQQLQQARLQARLQARPAPDLRARWPWSLIAGLWLAALVIAGAVMLWPSRTPDAQRLAPAEVDGPVVPGVPRLVAQRLQVMPPAYTGLPARFEPVLDAKAPEGTRLAWALRFQPQPDSAALVFHDGQRVALVREGDTWSTHHTLAKSTLYRVVASGTEGQPPSKLHRLDAIPDRPPQVKVLAPDRGLSLVTAGQTRWAVSFEAGDDYGIAPTASLKLTLAKGSGENIEFIERAMTLRGSGPATARRFTASLDLATLGMAVGDDLIAQLTVHDNRAPAPQPAQSPGLILRWPADLGEESTGLEGMVKKVMPAYFRSQRQIIIDAEALQKQRRTLAAERFTARSDEIGVDQRILRLRYGQFLGEEADGEPQPPPTNDDNDGDNDGDNAGAHSEDDGHDHGEAGGAAGPSFGREADVLEAYGHTHDHAEAATLLDPETRDTLKKALDQMWSSELHLRQGHPDKALPYAYKALEYIKQVQQATRIYLARVGPELPPIDDTRRMGGDRAGLASRALGDLVRATGDDDSAPAQAWRALAGSIAGGTRDGSTDLDALERWLRQNEARVPDALDLFAAIDSVRNDPACGECRQRLRARLWSATPQPPAQVPRRAAPDADGRRYLDALRQEPPP